MRASHPLINQYVQRHALADAVKENGQAVLLVDDRYRVIMTGDAAGWLVLMARVAALPHRLDERRRLCADVALQATGMLSAYASNCVVDADDAALWLQQMVRPESSAVEVEDALADFVNALEIWLREFGDGEALRGQVQ